MLGGMAQPSPHSELLRRAKLSARGAAPDLLRFSSLRIAFLIGVVLAIVRLHGCAYLDQIDLRARDYRLVQRGVQPASPDVVIVAIDDASLEQFGRWPWSRARVAELIDRLAAAEPAVIGFDVVQSESTANRDLDGIRQRFAALDEAVWQELRGFLDPGGADEARLAEAVRGSGRTVLGYFFEFDRQTDEGPAARLPSYNLVQGSRGRGGENRVPLARGIKANLPELTEAARSVGYFNFVPDVDGAYRRAPLAIRFTEQLALPLSLAMLQVYRPQSPLALRFAEFGVETIRFGPDAIPVAEDGEMLINYRGPQKTFRHIAAADVLQGRVGPEELRGKLVLVGVTATAVADIRVTPFDGTFPGVEIHANVLDNILRRDFIMRPGWTRPAEAVLVLLIALLLGALLHYTRGVVAALIATGLLGIYLVLSQWAFVAAGLLLSVLYPGLAVTLAYPAIALHQYVAEEREKRKIREAFGLYLSPSLARLVSERPEMLALGGDKRELTVLFSDIRGFTSLSEQLEPEVLVELLNTFLGEMTDIILGREGMLDKYIGDAIMAVWGAPLPQSDHAARSCRAALAMTSRLTLLNQYWEPRGWPALEIGVGLNTGAMVVGNMGSVRRLSYTVIGDNVNLGSRLEGLNKLYGTRIIASEATIAAAGEVVVARELDRVRVKGRRLPVKIFEILAPAEEHAAWAPVIDRFAAGLAAYRNRQWTEAVAAFESVLALRQDDGPARLYLRRCGDMMATPPDAQWDGVTIMDTK